MQRVGSRPSANPNNTTALPIHERAFLPAWPPELGPLFWVAVLLLAAIMAGEAVRRWLHASRIIGYVAVGVVLGPIAGLVDKSTMAQLRIFADVAIGLLLFEL